ncbi:phage portal protein [Corynebacterium amycolatum]|uniref:phage portal protein n=1 Tax=Corynebacterium amycolatum TaxID=43765 RepID=UPI001248CC5F|nr:phage portal protein [Corynebacterium amycolatum]KAA9227075.1 phage portal protein [Corynebacterium amycolatum]
MTVAINNGGLSPDEQKLLQALHQKWLQQRGQDIANEKLFAGLQKVAQLGIAVPPEVEPFAFPMNWPRMYVEVLEQRMDVRLLLRSGVIEEDQELRADWEANSLELEHHLAHTDLLVYGRCVASVSWPDRESGQTRPVIRVESPRDIAVIVDPYTRATRGALRVYADEMGIEQRMTLYLPNETVHLAREAGKDQVVSRDRHDLGRVPVVCQWNRRMSGRFSGTSQMEDIKHWVGLMSRVVLNLQLAMETIATPQKVAIGVSQKDFVDPDTGEDLDPWETYMGAIWAISRTTKEGVDVKQLPAGDLAGFISTVEMITKQVAGQTGLPLRMLGHSTVNPASEGGIKADEARLVKTVERLNTTAGVFWSWVLGIAERVRTGVWPEGAPIQIEWRNPATPTLAEMADAMQKQTGGAPTLSVRGALNQMGYSQARIDKELQWLEEEAAGMYTPVDAKLERQPPEMSLDEPSPDGGGA